MPNWCATNYAVTGDRTELQQFADLVNSLPSREDVKENGFGKFWLGNLAVHLGGDWEKGHFRGVLNPDPEAGAYLFGPDVNENDPIQLTVEEKGEDKTPVLFFSTQTAWSRSLDLEDLLRENYPSMDISYKSTYEFGNFHEMDDPDRLLGQKKYYIYIPDVIELSSDDEKEVISKTLESIGEEYSEGITWNDFCEKIVQWSEDSDDSYYEIECWE